MNRGLIIAAPGSGSGKTTVTLGLLRALRDRGHSVRGAKSGPDYIDPRFHEAACGETCLNLDAWAMSPERIASLVNGEGLLIIEGAMGLFDGAPPVGRGACADLARQLSLPVVLVVDAAKTAQSIAPLVAGFAAHDPDVQIKGIILNNVGSPRHEKMLRTALGPFDIPILGALYRQYDLVQPSRHLGLVQAEERPDLDAFLSRAGELISDAIDLEALVAQAASIGQAPTVAAPNPPAQRIAIAQDRAFAFAYPHLSADWRAAGAEISFFSPLHDDAVPDADFIYLPGGYPELHAGRLSAAQTFMSSMRRAAKNSVQIYGECGGYMTLGDGIIDKDGHRHAMLGLLALETSFAKRKLHLGYRHLSATEGPFQGAYNAHEFHYATTLKAEGRALFHATDAEGTALPDMGLIQGSVAGSFAHLIEKQS
ncbi:cobyrinate a,c-diamide synthase [Cochlodiniinecator piscidefendens]|uniref:cobyrinate a,c-diamide synthase n=1 Tax=Cochlodiniinecator piscidefendens TaxID=2715756 RepID=UPI00140B9D6C|nr:cobyrinate a,c-diamide synthase [Cochlodiniinecator piscidefendens]